MVKYSDTLMRPYKEADAGGEHIINWTQVSALETEDG